MSTYTCDICNKSFASAYGLSGHRRMHGQSGGTNKQIICCCIITRRELVVHQLKQYQDSLIPCRHCNKLFRPSNKIRKIFCSHSCSATYNNKLRTQETKQAISAGIKRHYSQKHKVTSHPKPAKINPDTSKSKYVRTCKHCNTNFVCKLIKKYCSNCAPLYLASARNQYKFTFNIFKYPELFDITQIQNIGFYAPGGKSGRWNPTGLSRDHRVSVNEAIKNQYDPYYITHPLNCELIPHSINNKKKTRCSITWEELVKIVDDYDKQKNGS